MTNALKIILNFQQLLKKRNHVFTPEMIESLPKLLQQLNNLETQDDYSVAKLLVDWVQPYEQLKYTLRTRRADITDDGIDEETEREDGQYIDNIFLLRETIQEVIEESTTDQNKIINDQ